MGAARCAGVLRTDVGTLRELAPHGRPLEQLVTAGRATVTGNRHAAARLVACFTPPSPE